MTCTFIGSREPTASLYFSMETVLRDLIENKGVDSFYIGHQGLTDETARTVLSGLRQRLRSFHVFLILYGGERNDDLALCTLVSKLEHDGDLPPHTAYAKRYIGLLEKSDYVVVACRNPQAAEYIQQIAEKYDATVLVI